MFETSLLYLSTLNNPKHAVRMVWASPAPDDSWLWHRYVAPRARLGVTLWFLGWEPCLWWWCEVYKHGHAWYDIFRFLWGKWEIRWLHEFSGSDIDQHVPGDTLNGSGVRLNEVNSIMHVQIGDSASKPKPNQWKGKCCKRKMEKYFAWNADWISGKQLTTSHDNLSLDRGLQSFIAAWPICTSLDVFDQVVKSGYFQLRQTPGVPLGDSSSNIV